MNQTSMLKFNDGQHMRTILTCSLLSAKPVIIDNITPKITDAEAMFVNILAKIAPSTKATISADGKKVTFEPGIIEGGDFQFDCPQGRSLGYYLEYLLLILPFAKYITKIQLQGETHNNQDLSVDYISSSLIPQLRYFSDSQMNLQVNSRAFGGQEITPNGRCVLSVTPTTAFKSLQFTKPSPFKQMNGIILSLNVPPTMGQRLLMRVKQNFSFVPNIQLRFETKGGKMVQSAPGFGCMLEAETMDGGKVACELYTDKIEADPENMADYLCADIGDQIRQFGCCDTLSQQCVVLASCFAQEDVSFIRLGTVQERVLGCLRVAKEFFGVEAQLEEYKIEGIVNGINLVVRGAGVRNVSKMGW
ncbi:RNA_3'-terminal phosphate cyclase-like protein [Hexamita inflata]|uniref:RNA 3'-terminal phosphate cyclase-like protein n=1 Tax=Hexamita inflata TaxID=28002 RepID=A0AA86QPC4_9EUKA|nr:RNA 3'-terminal phosphate cyclase-like protein [Hexamita inflata]CAI9955520.1 RNA 3'-terminal phosphate cyclase-like protein [Hexamita inflata]